MKGKVQYVYRVGVDCRSLSIFNLYHLLLIKYAH